MHGEKWGPTWTCVQRLPQSRPAGDVVRLGARRGPQPQISRQYSSSREAGKLCYYIIIITNCLLYMYYHKLKSSYIPFSACLKECASE